MLRVPEWQSELGKPSCVKRGTEYEVPWFQRRGYYIHKPASHGFAPLSQRISTAELITDASSPQSRVANMLKNPKFQPSNGTQTHSVQHLQLLWRLVYTTHHWVSKEGSAGYVVLSALNSFPHSCAPSCVLQYTDGTLRLIKMQSCTLDTVTINHYPQQRYCLMSFWNRQVGHKRQSLQCQCNMCEWECEWYKDLDQLNLMFKREPKFPTGLETRAQEISHKWLRRTNGLEIKDGRSPDYYCCSVLTHGLMRACKDMLLQAQPCIIDDYSFHSWGVRQFLKLHDALSTIQGGEDSNSPKPKEPIQSIDPARLSATGDHHPLAAASNCDQKFASANHDQYISTTTQLLRLMHLFGLAFGPLTSVASSLRSEVEPSSSLRSEVEPSSSHTPTIVDSTASTSALLSQKTAWKPTDKVSIGEKRSADAKVQESTTAEKRLSPLALSFVKKYIYAEALLRGEFLPAPNGLSPTENTQCFHLPAPFTGRSNEP